MQHQLEGDKMLKATIHRFEWPGSKELACALCLLLALGALGIWANLVGYGTAFILPAETSPAFEATRYAFHGGRALAALLLLLFPKTVDRASVAASAIIPIFMSFCTVGFSIAPFQTLLSTHTVSIVASLVLGFAYIWVIVALYVSIARCLPLGAGISVVLFGQIIEQVASTAINYGSPPLIQLYLCCTCPAVSTIALMTTHRLKAGMKQKRIEKEPFSDRALRRVSALLLSAGIAIVVLGALSNVGLWGAVRPDYAMDGFVESMQRTCIACVLLLAFSISLFKPMRYPLVHRYQIPLLILIASIMVALLQPYAADAEGKAIAVELTSAEFFAHVLLWTILIAAIKETGRPAYRLAGIALFPYCMCSLGWIVLMENDQTASLIFALAVAFAIILLISTRSIKPPDHEAFGTGSVGESASTGASGTAALEAITMRCAFIGSAYGLSNREIQVLELLAQGRSRPFIQQKLVLSEGTVKTHISHVYEKIGVSSLQNLLDVLYENDARRTADGSTTPET